MKIFSLDAFLFLLLFLVVACSSHIDAQTCYPSGRIPGTNPPPGRCNIENDSECCVEGKFYNTYTCSPSIRMARLTLNSFEDGGDGGAPSKCDNRYHSNNDKVVALSTGWFNYHPRCNKYITINGNGRSVQAMVVDECDSTVGCDEEHAYQPPCPNNIVDASRAVWEALGVPENEQGDLAISWYDS